MNPTDSPNPAARVAQRRRHVRTIRRRVAALAAGTFLAATGGIVAQLVSGHDPALASIDTSTTSTHRASTSTTIASAPSPITTSAS